MSLPSAYQEVEYIWRNGNNYIDTWWVPKLTAPFEVKVWYKISTSWVRYWVLSNYNGNAWEAWLTSLEINDWSHTNNVARFYSERTSWSNTANIYSSNTLNVSWFNDLVYTNNGSSSWSVTLNGITTNGSVKTDWYSNLTAYLFIDRALRWSTYSHNSFISYCKIYESWTLVRDFVPCYRKSDSVIGLYDLVNNQFYTNSWTGTFTKWGDVNNYYEKNLKNAYIGEVWTPTSNTVAYYPLTSTSTVNDMSGNNRNLTNGWSVTFWTYKWVNCAYFSWSNYLYNSNLYSNQNALTVSWWEYYVNNWFVNSNVFRWWWNLWPRHDRDKNYALACSPWLSPTVAVSSDTQRHHYAFTYSWWSTWTLKFYVDWVLIWTNTSATPPSSSWIAISRAQNSDGNYFKWWQSEIIIENSVRDDTKISDYYNLTKSNYWIS